MNGRCLFARSLAVMSFWCAAVTGPAADGITWRAAEKSVDADVRGWNLIRVLDKLAQVTGWEVFVEPGAERTVTVAFNKNSPDEALKKLLGNVNYSLVTPTNGVPRLYAYLRSAREATQRINPRALLLEKSGEPKLIPNELVVTLKPGSKTRIEDLARLLGAKVIGRIDGLNAYRLQFDDEAEARSARLTLESNSDVSAVDANYSIERPPTLQTQLAGDAPLPKLKLTAPPADGRITVGLIDTAIQPLTGSLNDFVLKGISVAGDPGPLPDTPLHATAMAETILRALAGKSEESSGVRILPVDVYGANPTTSTFEVTDGFYKAVSGGANLINMSLGGTGDSSVLRNLIQQSVAQGVVILAAAGNEPVTTPTLPAAWPEVTAVSALAQDGGYAEYANHGTFVDLLAPDTSAVHESGRTFVMSGTSVSTAFATGATAARAERGGLSLSAAVNQVKQMSPPPAPPK